MAHEAAGADAATVAGTDAGMDADEDTGADADAGTRRARVPGPCPAGGADAGPVGVRNHWGSGGREGGTSLACVMVMAALAMSGLGRARQRGGDAVAGTAALGEELAET